MKKSFSLIIVLGLSMSAISVAYARNTQHFLPLHIAINTPAAQQKLNSSIKFFFSNQSHPQVLQDFGYYVSNKKTNAFGKSDATACNWAFLSAMMSLQKKAQAVGANAIVNIVSYYDKKPMSSKTQFECHAGAMVAGVVLKGNLVKIATNMRK